MALPDFQTLMRPVLATLSDGHVWAAAQLRDAVATELALSPEDRDERYQRGGRRFDGRVHWAVTYLAAAGAVARVGRGRVQITHVGEEVLSEGPERITVSYLMRFPDFADFRTRVKASSARSTSEVSEENDAVTYDPQDQISRAVEEINAAVAAEVVDRIKAQPPQFLERIILDLMVAMGYGALVGRAEHLGGPGDEGFDGVIHQDALGLERVYLQAKRYSEQTVGRPAVQAFAGALQGAGATRGVLITTSRFTAEARDFADRLPARVVLIDGLELGTLLVKHKVGVQVAQSYDVVQLDEDAFDD